MAMAARSSNVVSGLALVLALLGSAPVGAEMIGDAAASASPSLSGSTSISKIDVGNVLSQAPGPLVNLSLYSGSTLFTGVSLSQFEVNIPGAGQLSIHLEDLDFPSAAGALSFALVDQGEVVGLLNGTGDLIVPIGGAATMYAFVYAVAAPGVNIASYYLDVSHEFEQPVPLPAALWLLLSGAGFVGWLGRRRA
jgi:hypothetical protein